MIWDRCIGQKSHKNLLSLLVTDFDRVHWFCSLHIVSHRPDFRIFYLRSLISSLIKGYSCRTRLGSDRIARDNTRVFMDPAFVPRFPRW
jgi:hypothetical protein